MSEEYEQEYNNRTSLFSEHINSGDLKEASLMLAALHADYDYFDHNVDDDLALVFFSQNDDPNSVQMLLDLGVDPTTYDNAAIKGAVAEGYIDVVTTLATDNRVDIISALKYAPNENISNILKKEIIKRLSRQGDEESLKILLDDESFRIDGIMDVLRPDHKRKYAVKMLSEMSRAFRPVRSQLPPHVVRKIAQRAYDLSGMELYEIMNVINPVMKK